MKPTSSFLVSMRSNLLALFAGVVVAFFVSAQSFTPTDVAWMGQLGAVVEEEAPSYLVSEDFEGSGTADGWVNNNTPDWDYTTAPAPLVGSESLGTDNSQDWSTKTFSADNEVWAFCYWNASSFANAPYFLDLLNSGGTTVAKVRILSTGAVRVYNGTSNAETSAGAVATNTTYCMWVQYIKGSGANGITRTYIAAGSETRPALTKEITNGNATTDCDRVKVGGQVNDITVIDKVRVSASEIGSDPS